MKYVMIWILVFLEGGMVMIAELCAAKILAPFYGNSIYVWAATLSVTLGGLAIGYFVGSTLSKKDITKNKQHLKYALIIGGIWMILMFPISAKIMPLLLNLSLGVGASLSLVIYLMPALICFGTCSPLFINILNQAYKQEAGTTAGKVYAFSTIGGIVFTMLTGFYFIPSFGLKTTLVMSGLIIGISSLIILGLKYKIPGIGLTILLFLSVVFSSFVKPQYKDDIKVLAESDGVLGNIKIIDLLSTGWSETPTLGRGLVVNNSMQTFMKINGPEYSHWHWAYLIPSIAGVKPAGSDALLVGLGGGITYRQFKSIGINTDVVELDERIKEYAIHYFNVPKEAPIFIDDGRHFIKKSKKTYDIIYYDTFFGESQPEHLLTKEGIIDAISILKKDGFMIINFYGFTEGEEGYAARSIMKTILDLKLNLHVIPTPGEQNKRSLFFVLSPDILPNYFNTRYQEPGMPIFDKWSHIVTDQRDYDLTHAEILTDDKPNLSLLFRKAASQWRKGYNEYFVERLYK